jgi:hypothetical protein
MEERRRLGVSDVDPDTHGGEPDPYVQSTLSWILEEDRKGLAPSYLKVIEMVTLILRADGDLADLGHNWIYAFLRCSQTIKPLLGRKIDAALVNSSTEVQVNGSLFARQNCPRTVQHLGPERLQYGRTWHFPRLFQELQGY